MSDKEIEAWKNKVVHGKTIFVATKVKEIHPVVDKVSIQWLKIEPIKYIRIAPD